MCRMLACMTAEDLPADLLPKFRRLAHEGMVPPKAAPGHVSGWGTYASDGRGFVLHYRSKVDALQDPTFQPIQETLVSLSGPRTMMLHLRKASVGTPKITNSHPFVVGGRAFMNNGTIKRISQVYDGRAVPSGQTDTERFFLMLLDRLNRRDLPSALKDVLRRVEGLDYSSLTFILQDDPFLYAYRHFARYEGYYTLYYAKAGSSVFIASEPFYERLAWTPLKNRELVRARFVDGRAEVERCPVI
jgi:predicted glutamine amidotransferase